MNKDSFRQPNSSKQDETVTIPLNILNGIDAFVCVTVPETGEVLFLNDRLRNNYGIEGDGAGAFCYKIILGIDKRCDFCPYYQLKKEPEKTIIWEHHEPLLRKIYRKTAMLIDWPGGKKGHLEYGIDITDIIETQKALEYHDKMLTAHKNIAITFSQNDKAFGDVMTDSVGFIADAVDLDRIALWRCWTETDGSHAAQVYRWDKNSGGATVPAPGLDNIHYSRFAPDWDKLFLNGECINGPVNRTSGGDALKAYGMVSAFISPIFIKGNFWGVAIFEDRHKEIVYDKEQTNLMRAAAHLCANSIIREEMRLEIAEQNELNLALFSAAPVGFITYDENYNVLSCNDCMSAICGVSNEYYVKHFYELLPEYQPDGAKSSDKVREMMKRGLGGETYTVEWVYCTYSGDPIPCEVTSTRVKIKDTFIGLGYVYDLRNIKKLEQSVIDALIKAKAANRAKSEFLSRMSHEMLTPMNAIMGMTQLIKLQGGTDKISNYVDEIDTYSHHLLRLINDLLDMSDMDDGAFILTESAFSFNTMIQDVLKEAEYMAGEKRQQFSCDIDPAIPSTLSGDSKRLSQVIIKLLSNAVKFTSEQGSINFSAGLLGKDKESVILKIEVADNGIGISKEEQNKLFSVFEQVDGSTTRKFGGAGLGLAFSRKVIELMGGKIWVDSEPGKGSKFTFTCKLKEL